RRHVSTARRPTSPHLAGGLSSDGVAPADRVQDVATRAVRRRLLDGADLVGELGILDHLPEPRRVLATTGVGPPRLLGHGFCQLPEPDEVRRAQVQAPLGPPEVEAPLRGQLALRVLAQVTAMVEVSWRELKPQRAPRTFVEPRERDLAAAEGRAGSG